jgi:phosphosulfolactate synthase
LLIDGSDKERIDSKKPRKEGLTCIIDKMAQSFDKDSLEIIAPFIDIVKIYSVIPLLIPETLLEKKIKLYHDFDILVSTGSTITEYAILEDSFGKFVKDAAKIGFDMVEIGENNIDIDVEQKKKIVDTILSNNLSFYWKVGKKDPRRQLDVDKTLNEIEEAVKINSTKIILEANEGVNVGIYDEKGLIKWNVVGALTSKYPPNIFIFETPLESQQSALIAEFGQRVNLSEVRPDAITSIESQRRGFLSKAAFSVSYLRKDPEGGPATKFIYYIVRTKHPIDQAELINLTHLPRRTIQNAIEELKNQGIVIEKSSLEDARKKVYTPVHSDWL